MSLSLTILLKFFGPLMSAICHIDDSQLARVPGHGPLILIINHVNILEVPVLYTRIQPRSITGFFAGYHLESPLMRWLLLTLNGIPVQRGTPDRAALREGISRIRSGSIFAIAPEGTRSKDGRLGPGKQGVVTLAQKTGAPILPIVHWGSEHWQDNVVRLRRTPFNIAVGRSFRLDTGGKRVNRHMRQEIMDEIMAQMAALLPQEYRGVYADQGSTQSQYLRFTE